MANYLDPTLMSADRNQPFLVSQTVKIDMPQASRLEQALETIEETIEVLPIEDQEMLVDLMYRRLAERRRNEIAKNIAQAKDDYRNDNVFRGTVEDAIAELNHRYKLSR